MSKCGLDPCDGEPVMHITWGLYSAYCKGRPYSECDLCQRHVDDLWAMCKGAVTAGLMHWACSPTSGVEVDPYPGAVSGHGGISCDTRTFRAGLVRAGF